VCPELVIAEPCTRAAILHARLHAIVSNCRQSVFGTLLRRQYFLLPQMSHCERLSLGSVCMDPSFASRPNRVFGPSSWVWATRRVAFCPTKVTVGALKVSQHQHVALDIAYKSTALGIQLTGSTERRLRREPRDKQVRFSRTACFASAPLFYVSAP